MDILESITQKRQQMVDQLIDWCNINSGSTHLSGLQTMAATIQKQFQTLQADFATLEAKPYDTLNDAGEVITQQNGKCLYWQKRSRAPIQVLLCGHYDTVFSATDPFQKCTFLSDQRLNGPGVADMKGGILVLLHALQTFETLPIANRVGWKILLVADEEIGSFGSTPHLEQIAKNCDYGLIYEPSISSTQFAGNRKGSGLFSLAVRGRAAHAGREPHLGRNAIHKLAQAITTIVADVTKYPGLTVNPGRISGGSALNQIADHAVCHFNFRCHDLKGMQGAEAILQQVVADINGSDGFSAKLFGKFHRPPKVFDAKQSKLASIVNQSCLELGIKPSYVDTGGCCDGNNLQHFGVDNIDTLGVVGGNIHTAFEYIELQSLVERTQLSTLILTKIASQ